MLDKAAARPTLLSLSTTSTRVPAPCDDVSDPIVLPDHVDDPDLLESFELRNARAVEMEIKRRHVPITTGLHPVDIATERLDHALEQCDTLDREIRDFLNTRPFAAVPDPDTSLASVVRGRIFREPPKRIGFLAADAISTIRISLDNLFWAFANHHSGAPDLARSRFPIYDDFWGDKRNCWSVDGLMSLRSVAYEVGEAIKQVQPCVRSKAAPSQDLLWVLRRLNEQDSRSGLITGAGVMTPPELGRTFSDGDILIATSDGATTASSSSPKAAFYVAVDDDGQLRGLPIGDLVRCIHDHVRHVVLPGFVGL